MIDLDLTQVFEVGLRKAYEDSRRGDESAPHVSHLGKCLLAVHLSRAEAPTIEKAPRTLQLLMKGLHDEDYIVGMIEKGLDPKSGWSVFRHGYVQDDDGMVGHLDIELWRKTGKVVGDPNGLHGPEMEHALIEIKTREWKAKWEYLGELGVPNKKTGERKEIKTMVKPGPYPEPSTTHRLQAIGYCQRRPVNPDGKHIPYIIFEWDRNLNGYHQFPRPGEWYDSDESEWLARHDEWTRAVIDLTDPSKDPVEMGIATRNADGMLVGDAPEEWMHDYCDYYQCAKNTNKDNPKFKVEGVKF